MWWYYKSTLSFPTVSLYLPSGQLSALQRLCCASMADHSISKIELQTSAKKQTISNVFSQSLVADIFMIQSPDPNNYSNRRKKRICLIAA